MIYSIKSLHLIGFPDFSGKGGGLLCEVSLGSERRSRDTTPEYGVGIEERVSLGVRSSSSAGSNGFTFHLSLVGFQGVRRARQNAIFHAKVPVPEMRALFRSVFNHMVGRSAAVPSDRLTGVFKKYFQTLGHNLPRQIFLK